jgi:amino acid permease
MWRLRREKPLALVLAALALVLLVLAVVYATVAPQSLPSFLPGHVSYHSDEHYTKRALACVFLAVLIGYAAWHSSRARRHWMSHR